MSVSSSTSLLFFRKITDNIIRHRPLFWQKLLFLEIVLCVLLRAVVSRRQTRTRMCAYLEQDIVRNDRQTVLMPDYCVWRISSVGHSKTAQLLLLLLCYQFSYHPVKLLLCFFRCSVPVLFRPLFRGVI